MDRGVFVIDHKSPILITDLSLEQAIRELEEKLPKNPLLIDLTEKNYQELWESFVQSQIIQGRKKSEQIENLSKKRRNVVSTDETTARTLNESFKSKKFFGIREDGR